MGTTRGIVVALAIAVVASSGMVAGCAPRVDGPAEQQRAADRADADALAAQLASLPGAVSAQVTLRRASRDPLGVAPASPGSLGALIVVDDRADRPALERAARILVGATAPEIGAPGIVIEVGAHRPTLAAVGPFTVEAGSRGPLRAALAGALALIAGLAGWIALIERPWVRGQRRGNSAQ